MRKRSIKINSKVKSGGQRQSEDGDTGAQGSQRSSFLSEEQLDFAKDEIDWLVSRLINPLGVSRLRHLLPNLFDL